MSMFYKTYIVNGKKVNVRIDSHAPILGRGFEAKVYPVKGKAYKLYRSFMLKKCNLGEKECLYLSKIPTKRVLLPDEPIYDENKKYCGYTAKMLYDGEKQALLNMTIPTFIENVKYLYEDSSLLTKYHVLMDDFSDDNMMVTEDEKIYIIDPGYFYCYSLHQEKEEPENLEQQNDEFIRNDILLLLAFSFFPVNDYFGRGEFLSSFSFKKEEFIMELIEGMKDCRILNDYRKKVLEEIENQRVY